MSNVDHLKYKNFVSEVTSKPSSDVNSFKERVDELKEFENVDLNRLLTAAIGISAEGGEFAEIVKKISFQGKPYNEANRHHMIIELGDVLWYIMQACIVLDTDLNEIMELNVQKLTSRYPENTFDVYYSENRKEGDI